MESFDLQSYFATLATMGALSTLITGFFAKLLNAKGAAAWGLSVAASMAVVFGGHFLGFGIAADLTNVQLLFHGAAVTLGANGIFSWDTTRALLNALSFVAKKK